jgi:sec-independent protein translocase protein TatB
MLSVPHIIVIFIVVLVVFGPEKLPELARNFGKVMAEFRRATGDLRSTFEGHLKDIEREAESRKPAPAAQPSPYSQSNTPEAAPASPGTVPSNAPYAAAVAPQAVETFPEEIPDPDLRRREPADDAYLTEPDLAPVKPQQSSEPSESQQTPERVTDGNVLPS